MISVFELRELVNLTKSRKHLPGDDGNGNGHAAAAAATTTPATGAGAGH
jgi:hypothetical protein